MSNADFQNIYLFLSTIKGDWKDKADTNDDGVISGNEFNNLLNSTTWDTNTLGAKPTNDIISKFFCEMLDTDSDGSASNNIFVNGKSLSNKNHLDAEELANADKMIQLYQKIKKALDSKITALSSEYGLSTLLGDTIKEWRKAINGFACAELIDKYGATTETSDAELNQKIDAILKTESVFKIHGEYVGAAVKKSAESQISSWAKEVGYSLNNDSAVNAIIDSKVNDYISANKNNLNFSDLKNAIEKAIKEYIDTAKNGQPAGQCDNDLINEIQTAKLMSELLKKVKTSIPEGYIAYEGNEKVYLNAIRGFIVNDETLKSNDKYKDNLSNISGYASTFFESDFANGLKKVAQDGGETGGVDGTGGSDGGNNGDSGTLTWKNGSKFEMTSLDTATITTASDYPTGTKFTVNNNAFIDLDGVNVNCNTSTGVLTLTADNVTTQKTCNLTVTATNASGNVIGTRTITVTIEPDEGKKASDSTTIKNNERSNDTIGTGYYVKPKKGDNQACITDAAKEAIGLIEDYLDTLIDDLEDEGYNTDKLQKAKEATISYFSAIFSKLSADNGGGTGEKYISTSITYTDSNGKQKTQSYEYGTSQRIKENNLVMKGDVTLMEHCDREGTRNGWKIAVKKSFITKTFKDFYDNCTIIKEENAADLGELKPTDNVNNNPYKEETPDEEPDNSPSNPTPPVKTPPELLPADPLIPPVYDNGWGNNNPAIITTVTSYKKWNDTAPIIK